MHRQLCRCIEVLAVASLLALVAGAPAYAASAGSIQAMRFADSSFDEYTESPSSQMQAWMRSHFWRMTTWSPYFDSRTSWYPNAWFYRDAYAIYTGSALAKQHPEWILKDPAGNKLYIPFACSGGACPEYAGDITNAAFRQWWIESAKAVLAHGYKGMYIDDVNMEFRVSNGQEKQVAPLDPATGKAMTYEAWRRYMAAFMEQIRAALPNAEIIHNVIWFSDQGTGLADPYIQREIAAANGVFLERGINDGGLTGGTGQWSLNAFLNYAAGVNARGTYVVLGNASTDVQEEVYDLAGFFLFSNGSDMMDAGNATPKNWWSGWEIQLGGARGARYSWQGLLRRDFANGMVLVNPPGEPTRTVKLSAAMKNADGRSVTSVRLPAASGAVLRTITQGAAEAQTNGGLAEVEPVSSYAAPIGASVEEPAED